MFGWLKVPAQYRDVAGSFTLYLNAYGNYRSMIRSPYLHFAVLMSGIAFPFWYGNCDAKFTPWFDMTFSILPNLLGFTLGGYAILLAFGDEKFKELLSGKDEDDLPSTFMMVNASFIHFIVIQTSAILVAITGKAWNLTSGLLAWLGFVLLVYSISSAVAAAMAVLNLADWFDEFKTHQMRRHNSSSPSSSEATPPPTLPNQSETDSL